jgi:hypothetical protein
MAMSSPPAKQGAAVNFSTANICSRTVVGQWCTKLNRSIHILLLPDLNAYSLLYKYIETLMGLVKDRYRYAEHEGSTNGDGGACNDHPDRRGSVIPSHQEGFLDFYSLPFRRHKAWRVWSNPPG